MDASGRYIISGPLTREIGNIRSPIRQFLDDWLCPGLRPVQDQYREAAPPLLIPPADKQDAHPGTVGTAADWLLRFLINPQPDMHLPLMGVIGAARAGIDLADGFAEVLQHTGIPRATTAADLQAILEGIPVTSRDRFDGPRPGNALDPGDLNRACWIIALLTEVFRGGPVAAARGPLARFAGKPRPSGDDLLALAPPAGLAQLGRFRDIFTGTLLPQLAPYRARGPSSPPSPAHG